VTVEVGGSAKRLLVRYPHKHMRLWTAVQYRPLSQIYLGFSTHVASERFQSHALESRFCDVELCMRWTPSIVPRGDDHNIGGRHGTASTDTKIDRQRFSRCCAGCENPAYAREKRPQDPNMAGTGLRASHVTNPRSEMPDGERLRG
jgi:hypothetical protein